MHREADMYGMKTRLIVTLAVIVVLIGGVAAGRHLLHNGGASPSSSASGPVSSNGSTSGAPTLAPAGAAEKRSALRAGPANVPTGSPVHAANGSAATGTASNGSNGGSGALADVPEFPVTPQVVHTATVDVRVGHGKLSSAVQAVTELAELDGGYVDNSTLSGGTARRAPSAAAITFRVPDTDFAAAIAKVSSLGKVNAQRLSGKDVTVTVAKNAASIAVLQDEVNLLQKKLAQATDINTFLQIEGQLFPVEQQLQGLQSSQAVLENSAALATVTVHLTAPGALLVTRPTPKPAGDAATVAWHYLRHNTLAVLDGLAVALGWALPVLILLSLLGLVVLWVVRRRRHLMTPA
jgi:hypothetical protein